MHGQIRQRDETAGVFRHHLCEGIVDAAGDAQALVRRQAVGKQGLQRQHVHVDVALVHVAQAALYVEHGLSLEVHGPQGACMHFARTIERETNLVAVDEGLGDHVGVDVDLHQLSSR